MQNFGVKIMIRVIRNTVIAALALGSTSVLAQTITVGSDSGTAGATVVIPVNFVAGATAVGSMDIDVDFDAAKFSDATGDCSVTNVGQALKTCSAAAGKVRISIAGDGTNALITGLAANISFTIADPVAAGGVDLDGVIFAASNVDGSADLPGQTQEENSPDPPHIRGSEFSRLLLKVQSSSPPLTYPFLTS